MERKISFDTTYVKDDRENIHRDRSASHVTRAGFNVPAIPENELQKNLGGSESNVNRHIKEIYRRGSLPSKHFKGNNSRKASRGKLKSLFGSLLRSTSDPWEDLFMARVCLAFHSQVTVYCI